MSAAAGTRARPRRAGGARTAKARTAPARVAPPTRAPRTVKANVRKAPAPQARARRVAAWRRGLLGAGLALLLGGAAFGLTWGFTQAKAHGLLQVRHIAFEGQARIPEGELMARLGLPDGIDLPDVDLSAVAGAVLSHPWIERVTVRRDYPDSLRIRVWERTPVAVVRATGGADVMVDAEGVILGPPDPGADALPRLTGVDAARPHAGERVDGARVRLGAEVAEAWGEGGALVDVADPDDPLLLADGLRVRLGAQGGYAWRLGRLSALKDEIDALAGKHGAEVDLRYDDRVIARPL